MKYVWLVKGCAEEGEGVLEVYSVTQKGFIGRSRHFKCDAELRNRLFNSTPRARHYLLKRLFNN